MKLPTLNNTMVPEEIINEVQRICYQYHIHCKIVDYKLDTIDPNAGVYVIASLNPLLKKENPMGIIERNKRHSSLFFPENFAIKITNNNLLFVINKLTDYCSEAEFIDTIFKQYNKDVPKKIRKDELYPLIEMNAGAYNPNYTESMRNIHKEKLKRYFEVYSPEKDKDKAWINFYRSEKYDGKKSHLSNLVAFRKQDEQEVSLDILFNGSSTVKKVPIAEHEYIKFKTYLQNCYPDVNYATGKMFVIDHGMLDDDSIVGKTITYEEYCKILDENFALQQYDAIKNLKPSYFKYIDIYYKEADEEIIAKILNDIQLRYAKCDDLQTLLRRDDIDVITIPYDSMMNFVSLAKSNHIPFYIDNIGRYSKPTLDFTNIIINVCDRDKIKALINRLIQDKISFSHVIAKEQETIKTWSLTEHLDHANNLKKQEKYKEKKEYNSKLEIQSY